MMGLYPIRAPTAAQYLGPLTALTAAPLAPTADAGTDPSTGKLGTPTP